MITPNDIRRFQEERKDFSITLSYNNVIDRLFEAAKIDARFEMEISIFDCDFGAWQAVGELIENGFTVSISENNTVSYPLFDVVITL